ncbi:hypothetical protein [Sporosarcina sp. JAI121]|uniref:hypothetical protein n=1 Tax=Sporosarcina sp. JAI121 TaxID=2723064 RepID=UPI0015CCF6A5|nr:hypothetical protein [Sporosarcina sp. JAI121]NYF23430.1 hypothetical protein [Sporosarcina sp. JAI121]
MVDMQLREKLKKVSEAAKHGDRLPERSKNAGLVVFLLLIGIGIIVLSALAIGLALAEHALSAAVIFSIAALLAFSVFKVMRADDVGQL